MAFDAKQLKIALRKVKGKDQAHFLFSPKDKDLQPLLEISKAPLKGRKVSEARKQVKGRVFIGRVRLADDNIYCFSSRQKINSGHFDRAMKLIAKSVRLLKGARLEDLLADSDSTESLKEAISSSSSSTRVVFPLQDLLPDDFSADKALIGLADAGCEAARKASVAGSRAARAERKCSDTASRLLDAEAALAKKLAAYPNLKLADAKLHQQEQATEIAVDAYMDAADTLMDMESTLRDLEQGGARARLTHLRNAKAAALDAAEKRKAPQEEIEKLRQGLADCNSNITDFDKTAREKIDALKKSILNEKLTVSQLLQRAEKQSAMLDVAENERTHELEFFRNHDPVVKKLQAKVSSASSDLDYAIDREDALDREHQKQKAIAEDTARQMQSRVDILQAKAHVEKASSFSTVDSIQQRSEVRKLLENKKLVQRLQEGDEQVLGERLAQMGTTPEEFLAHVGQGTLTIPKNGRESDGPTTTSKEDAKKKIGSHLGTLKEDERKALGAFKDFGYDWKKVKEKAGGGGNDAAAAMKTMEQVYELRKQFMDDALAQTTVQFMDNIRLQLRESVEKSNPGDNTACKELLKKIETMELVELDKPEKNSKEWAAYADGRTRRYRAKIPAELQEAFGETLTVNFFAPGSTNPTSDIDMQFICEENPTACTELIDTFRKVSQERMAGVREALCEALGEDKPTPLGSLAEVFDTNPYPAGFVTRPELGAGLHFSDSFTGRSVEDKKVIDIGLSLIRTLENPREGSTDPVDKLLKEAGTLDDTEALLKARRAVNVGVCISLRSQMDQAAALLKPRVNDTLLDKQKKLTELLTELLTEAKEAYGDDGPDVSGAWADAPPEAEALKAMTGMARRLQHALHEIAGTDAGGPMYTEARYQAFEASQKEVEKYTRARDVTLASGINDMAIARGCALFAQAFEQAKTLSEREEVSLQDACGVLAKVVEPHKTLFEAVRGGVPETPPDANTLHCARGELIEARKVFQKSAKPIKIVRPEPGDASKALSEEVIKRLEKLRSSTSALGTTAFILQGMALNNADEAYTSRGAIGEVVEANQMKREVITTTGSALSSLEANAGFFHEHVKEEQHKLDQLVPPQLQDNGQIMKLTCDTPAAGYDGGKDILVEFAVSITKYIERVAQAFDKEDSSHLRDAISGEEMTWLDPLALGLLNIKGKKHPETGEATETLTDDALAFLAKFKICSIGDLQRKVIKVEKQARVTMWAKDSIKEKNALSRPVMERLTSALKLDPEDDDIEDSDL